MFGKTIFELAIGDYAEQKNVISLENAYQYAGITGDNNPIHFDTELAYQSRFERPIAHGMILAGFISGVIGSKLPGFGCIYEKQSLKFTKPVFYDDEIYTRVTVMEINQEKNRITLKTECFNQRDEIVLTGEAVVLPRRGDYKCNSST